MIFEQAFNCGPITQFSGMYSIKLRAYKITWKKIEIVMEIKKVYLKAYILKFAFYNLLDQRNCFS